jgi:hypothetical protein
MKNKDEYKKETDKLNKRFSRLEKGVNIKEKIENIFFYHIKISKICLLEDVYPSVDVIDAFILPLYDKFIDVYDYEELDKFINKKYKKEIDLYQAEINNFIKDAENWGIKYFNNKDEYFKILTNENS